MSADLDVVLFSKSDSIRGDSRGSVAVNSGGIVSCLVLELRTKLIPVNSGGIVPRLVLGTKLIPVVFGIVFPLNFFSFKHLSFFFFLIMQKKIILSNQTNFPGR